MPNCSAMSATAWMITAGHSELVRRTSQPNAEADEEGDRHERRLGPAVADRQVGEPEDRCLADVGPARAHGPLQRSEQQTAELHLLREGLQRVRRSRATGSRGRARPVAAPRVRARPAGSARPRPMRTTMPSTPAARPPRPRWRMRSDGRHSGRDGPPRRERDEQRADAPARPKTRRPGRRSCPSAGQAGRRGSAARPRAACTSPPPPRARGESGEPARDAGRTATAGRSGPTRR